MNTNFDARWGQGKRNVFFRAGANYVGKTPNSEKETKNLIRFTKAVKPLATISYHCKGEIIYWRFFQKDKDTIGDIIVWRVPFPSRQDMLWSATTVQARGATRIGA